MSRTIALRGVTVGVVVAASLIVGCAGCSASSRAPAGTPAPATATPHFQTTWLPAGTYTTSPPTAQTLKWQGPNGTTGSVPIAEVVQLEAKNPSSSINMVVVTAAAYPPGYWQSFATSTTWEHFTEAGREVAINPGRSGSSTTAMSEDRGYIIQLITSGVSPADVRHIVRGIRWS